MKLSSMDFAKLVIAAGMIVFGTACSEVRFFHSPSQSSFGVDPTPTETANPTPTETATPTPNPTDTATPTPTATATPSPSPVPTANAVVAYPDFSITYNKTLSRIDGGQGWVATNADNVSCSYQVRTVLMIYDYEEFKWTDATSNPAPLKTISNTDYSCQRAYRAKEVRALKGSDCVAAKVALTSAEQDQLKDPAQYAINGDPDVTQLLLGVTITDVPGQMNQIALDKSCRCYYPVTLPTTSADYMNLPGLETHCRSHFGSVYK